MIALRKKKGMTLIITILVIVIIGITVLSTTVFIVEQLSLENTRRIRMKTIELAKAGIYSEIYTYRSTDYSPTLEPQLLLTQVNLDANHYFITGADDADMLMVDTSNSSIIPQKGKREAIGNFFLKNATSSQPIIIDSIVVHWDNNARLKFVVFDGDKTSAGGNQTSPATIDLDPDFVLDAIPTTYGGNSLIFSKAMGGSTVTIDFMMAGGTSSQSVTIFPASNKFNFTLRSTGRTTFSDIQRTVSAEYNSIIGTIENFNEINTHLIP